jgi:hypothetical protein
MTAKEKMNSIQKTARLAGFLYVLTVPFALFGYFYAPGVLVVAGDAVTTTENIMANTGLFRLSIVAALTVQVTYIFIVFLLYKLLNPVNRNLAVLMVVFILVGIPIAMLAELNHFAVLQLVSSTDHLKEFTAEQLHATVPMFFTLHEYGILIASIFWGLWLLPMGYLVLKSGFISRIPGVLLLIAGSGYLIDTFAKLLSPDYGTTIVATIISITLFGELLFPIWLLITGVNVEKWKKRALQSA